jgi:hypothetical protein
MAMVKVDHREIARSLIENRRKLTGDDYVELVDAIVAAGGHMVQAYADDDDWCATGRLPWPPKRLDSILEVIGKLGGGGRIIINGIPNPIDFEIVAFRERIRNVVR